MIRSKYDFTYQRLVRCNATLHAGNRPKDDVLFQNEAQRKVQNRAAEQWSFKGILIYDQRISKNNVEISSYLTFCRYKITRKTDHNLSAMLQISI